MVVELHGGTGVHMGAVYRDPSSVALVPALISLKTGGSYGPARGRVGWKSTHKPYYCCFKKPREKYQSCFQ